MKKYILMVTAVFFGYMAYAQPLYTEDFEGYLLGNLGTDPTGVIPGKGGWLTATYTQGTKNNNAFTIVNDPVKNKVLQLFLNAPKDGVGTTLSALKPLNDLIDNRAPGNNVVKFEIDYYAGTASQWFFLPHFALKYESTSNKKYLFLMQFDAKTGKVAILINNGQNQNYGLTGVNLVLPFNRWFTFIVYLDYDNKKYILANALF